MTTFFLIRHAANDLVGDAIAGRKPGVHLNAEGRLQAERLAERLEHAGIQHIFSSPLDRARETAGPLAAKLGLPVRISEAILEIDFGDWTGRKIAELNQQEAWRRWNVFRSGAQLPNNQLMLSVQTRMVSELVRLHRELPDDCVALVSHGDPIRSAIMYWLGVPLDFVHRLEISAASFSIIALDDWAAQVRCLNVTLESGGGLARAAEKSDQVKRQEYL